MSRVLYLGMAGAFSTAPLRRLLQAGTPLMVGYPQRGPAPAHQLPVRQPYANCRDLARDHGRETVAVTFEWQGRLAELGCDLLLVVCWPWILPSAVLDAFPGGAFNLHPSLLPRHRGPDPLFWQFRDGVSETGITLHRLSGAVDAGPIIAQRSLPLLPGQAQPEIESALGELGAELAETLIHSLAAGPPSVRSQAPADATTQPMPAPEDFQIPLSWGARRAYTFMCGVASRGQPFTLVAGSRRLRLRRARGYALGERLPAPPWERRGEVVRVQFVDGVLTGER